MDDDFRSDPRSDDRARRPAATIVDHDPSGDGLRRADDRWGTHASPMRRVSRLAVPDRSDRPGRFREAPAYRDDDGWEPSVRRRDDGRAHDDRREGVHVQVNNGGQHYRPWREELLLSGFRTVGDLLAWPFRLIGGLVGAAAKIMLIGVIAPAVFFGAVGFYMDHRNAPATETAHAVGKSGVGIVGSAFRGLWDGIVGNDDPAPSARNARAHEAHDEGAVRPGDRDGRETRRR